MDRATNDYRIHKFLAHSHHPEDVDIEYSLRSFNGSFYRWASTNWTPGFYISILMVEQN